MLGKQAPSSFTREKIRVLLKEQLSDVEPGEVDIISGVLALREKTAEQHMQKLKDVFMVDANEMFNEKLYTIICDSGYSRIPVFSKQRSNVVGVLHVKDLALISTSNHRTVGTICESFNLPFGVCHPEDGLDKLLRYILQNHFHMLLVQQTDDGIAKTTGTITLEDIMEELLDLEILDEFDATIEEKGNRFAKYKNIIARQKGPIDPQMKTGIMQILSTLKPFKDNVMAPEVLEKIVEQNYVEERNCQKKKLYEVGKQSDYFVLIVSGKAMVEAGRERLTFVVGNFAWFALPALEPEDDRRSPYIPDYSVYLNGDVSYIKISRNKWLSATRVSAFERHDFTSDLTSNIEKSKITSTIDDHSKSLSNNKLIQVKCLEKSNSQGMDSEERIQSTRFFNKKIL